MTCFQEAGVHYWSGFQERNWSKFAERNPKHVSQMSARWDEGEDSHNATYEVKPRRKSRSFHNREYSSCCSFLELALCTIQAKYTRPPVFVQCHNRCSAASKDKSTMKNEKTHHGLLSEPILSTPGRDSRLTFQFLVGIGNVHQPVVYIRQLQSNWKMRVRVFMSATNQRFNFLVFEAEKGWLSVSPQCI